MNFARALWLVAVLLVALANAAHAGNVTKPVSGAEVVSNAAIFNLYMASDWDQISQTAGITKEQLDAWTGALVNSAYLSAASNEYGIGTPVFLGGFNSNSNCSVPPISGVVGRTRMIDFVNCNVGKDPMKSLAGSRNVFVVLFADPRMTVAGALSSGPCGPSSSNPSWEGYHFATGIFPFSFTTYAVIPTNATCEAAPQGVTQTLFSVITNTVSHELVEGLTDPNCPLGWAKGTSGGANVPKTCNTGEVADICTNVGSNPAPFNDIFPFLLTGSVELYWDNSAEACGPPWAPLANASPAPYVSDVSSSIDSQSLNFTISGSGFGSLPGTTTLPFVGTIPYFLFSDQSKFNAGNVLDGDTVNATYRAWSDSSISVGIPLSAGLATCDPISLEIWNPSNGGTAQYPLSVPGVIQLSLTVPSVLALVSGDLFNLSVQVNPPSLVTPATFTLTSYFGTLDLTESGSFTYPLTALVGSYPLTVSTTACNGTSVSASTEIIVFPVINSVTPNHGTAGTNVTISGHGLIDASSVTFGGASATFYPGGDTQMGAVAPPYPTPPPTSGVSMTPAGTGTMQVAVTSAGLTSYNTASQGLPYPNNFTYYQHDIPVFSSVLLICQGDTASMIVSAWNSSGNPDANRTIAYSVAGGTLSPNNTTLNQSGTDNEIVRAAAGTTAAPGTTTVTAWLNKSSPATLAINWMQVCPLPISGTVLHGSLGSGFPIFGSGPIQSQLNLTDVAILDGGGIYDFYLFDPSQPQKAVLLGHVDIMKSAAHISANVELNVSARNILRKTSSPMIRIVSVNAKSSLQVKAIELDAVH